MNTQTGTKKAFRPAACIVAVTSVLSAAAVRADEGDAFNVVLSQGFRYESNLYRLESGAEAPGGTRHDTVSETGAALMFDRRYGRQRLLGELGVTSARYAEHDELDHDRRDAGLAWQWALGNRWSGVLGHQYRERLTSFDETSGFTRNMNAYARSTLSADYWWHPRWATGASVQRTRSRFDREDSDAAEFDANTIDLNLTYRPPTGNKAILTLRETDGQYVNRPAVEGSIRDYRQQELRLSGEWQLTGATKLSGFIGQTRVEYRFAPNRDFTGTIGRLGVLWSPTVKTSFALGVRREIGAQQDAAANYAVTEAVSLLPKWVASDKLTLSLPAEWRRRDYGGDPEFPGQPGAARGTERSYRYGLALEYRPIRALGLHLGVHHLERLSAQRVRPYSDDIVELSAQFRF